MNVPRLFVIAGCLLLLNMVTVLSTSVWRYVGADEPRVSGTLLPSANTVQNSASGSSDVEKESAPPATAAIIAPTSPSAVATANPEGDSANLLQQIPIPESLPVIPSLADPESLKNDPGFQEFSRLFSKVEESWESDYPNSASPRSLAQSSAYFEALDGRLETVEQLCSAARNIAREAARHSRSGQAKESEELVQMVTQLRDMAAKLLVGEL